MAPRPTLDEIYDEHAQAIFGLLMSLTQSKSDTWDVLQELFIKLARQPELLDNVRKPRAYLLRLGRNIALDHIRRRAARQKNHEASAAESGSQFEPVPSNDEEIFRRALGQALLELPIEQRTVLHLKLWEGLTLEEISDALAVSANTVASRFRYGLEKLRTRLRPLYEEIN